MRRIRNRLSGVCRQRTGHGGIEKGGFLGRVIQKITRSLARVDVETGQAVCMVVIEHQPPTLVVSPKEAERALAWIVAGACDGASRASGAAWNYCPVCVEPHIGNVRYAIAFLILI